jgi:uncharacterized protein (TIGR03437 family)
LSGWKTAAQFRRHEAGRRLGTLPRGRLLRLGNRKGSDGRHTVTGFVSPGQINGAVPYGVAGKPGTRIAVEQAGKETVALTLPVADAAPGIFTADSSGSGQAAAWNQNGAWNSAANPADRGSVVVLYATGAGLTDPPSIDGRLADPPLPQPLLLVSVRIGGRDASVLYAGASAGLLAGILQVNAVVPEDAPTGDAVPVTLIVGGAESQPGVTLAVR